MEEKDVHLERKMSLQDHLGYQLGLPEPKEGDSEQGCPGHSQIQTYLWRNQSCLVPIHRRLVLRVKDQEILGQVRRG
jgi:hypothetical protein